MKNKLKFLMKQSLDKKIHTKWFKIVNLLILILLIGVMNIDRIVSFFGGDFKEYMTIQVQDDVGIYDQFTEVFNGLANNLKDSKNYKLEKTTDDIETLKNSLKSKDNKIILTLQKDPENYITANLYSYDEISTITSTLISSSLTSVKSGLVAHSLKLNAKDMANLTHPIEIKTEYLSTDANNTQGKDFMSAGVIIIFIVPCFFLIILLVQMIGAEVNEEKTSRSMEIIISNVSPKTHFLSKVGSATMFTLIQGLLLLLYGGIAFGIRECLGQSSLVTSTNATSQLMDMLKTVVDTGILSKLAQGLPIILVLFLFSFLTFAIIAGVLASVTTSIEDFQQIQTPLMLIIVAGYYISIMAVSFNGSVFIQAVSYIPMLSFLVSPVLYMLGQVSLVQMGISTIITILFTFIVFKYGLRIYKEGILNYSSTNLWKKIVHSMKR